MATSFALPAKNKIIKDLPIPSISEKSTQNNRMKHSVKRVSADVAAGGQPSPFILVENFPLGNESSKGIARNKTKDLLDDGKDDGSIFSNVSTTSSERLMKDSDKAFMNNYSSSIEQNAGQDITGQ